jgi:hypothetical protein
MRNSSEHDLQDGSLRERDFMGPAETGPALLAALLDEWIRGDESEQRETFDVLTRSLDEDRPEGYTLFSRA